jgi:hypothetical protein
MDGRCIIKIVANIQNKKVFRQISLTNKTTYAMAKNGKIATYYT